MNRTNMNRYFFACALIVLSSNAWADQPPSWQPFSVKSENAKFVATVAPQDEEKPALPWESAYRIEVRSVEGDQPGPAVWNRRYAFSGYEGGLLSNDGVFCVCRLLVSSQRCGGRHLLKGRVLLPDR
ncbi:hypothetical protein [Massilia sp. CF038]|uniref:hypothetical protein n=1 Tax=Massilia sp. CF038 TaxID=1881045 RepID=UPI001160FA3E|nr:hypothetical protein [Massilia sp. CF038]